MTEIVVRNAFDRVRCPVVFDPVSMTKQAFKDECDINRILAKYRKTGMLEHVNRYQGNYSDVSLGISYQEALNGVMQAKDMFMTLPADVRSRFGNDPGSFLDFVSNPDNKDEMQAMGLLKPVVAPVVPAPPSPPAQPAATNGSE